MVDRGLTPRKINGLVVDGRDLECKVGHLPHLADPKGQNIYETRRPITSSERS